MTVSYTHLSTAISRENPEYKRAVEEGIPVLKRGELLAKLLNEKTGVAANSLLRKELKEKGAEKGIEVSYPSMKLCTDNGAMIALSLIHI